MVGSVWLTVEHSVVQLTTTTPKLCALSGVIVAAESFPRDICSYLKPLVRVYVVFDTKHLHTDVNACVVAASFKWDR